VTSERVRSGALGLLIGRIGGVAGALAVSQIITGVSYVVAARSIGPANLGLIATCVSIGVIGSTVFDAGLTSLLVREVASGKLTMPQARGVVRAKRRLAFVLLVPELVACWAIAPTPASGLLLGTLGIAMWEAQTANALLRAQELFSRASIGQLAGRTGGFLVVVVLVAVGTPVSGLAAGIVVSFAAEAVLGRVFLGRSNAKAHSQREVLSLYREAIGYGLAWLAVSAQQLDTPLVTLGAGATGGGLYAAAGRLLGPLSFLASSLGFVGAPWLARAMQEPGKLRSEEGRVLRIAAVLTVAPLAAAALGPFLIPLVLGSQYESSGTVFVILALGSVISTMNQPLAIIIQNRGHQQVVALAIAVGLGTGLVVTYVLAVVGGATLAAIGFTISQLYILGHLSLAVRRLRRSSEETT
jgi:O-antigen/teichoic acid export membrane protein